MSRAGSSAGHRIGVEAQRKGMPGPQKSWSQGAKWGCFRALGWTPLAWSLGPEQSGAEPRLARWRGWAGPRDKDPITKPRSGERD